MLDATTAIEDKDFWSNPGFDVAGFVSATVDTLSGHPRGGSTITQQLVRARLLPESAFTGSREERKIREIIQSLRLTEAYPGQEGKQAIITAYLNQNFYGNQSYGVKAAAKGYFGSPSTS
jgi:peptidoglycan glycosyltransferase